MLRTESHPPHISRLTPDDPRPRGYDLEVGLPLDEAVMARVDLYSDRLRCDHPQIEDGEALGLALRMEAARSERGRIVVLAEEPISAGLESVGFEVEAVMPGFYQGENDCQILSYALNEDRAEVGHPAEVSAVDALLGRAKPATHSHPTVETERAGTEDAAEIAGLITATFDQYPTPSGDPEYISQSIAAGTPFRIVRDEGEVIACASADLIRSARTAELTDCATRPEARGRGLMQGILGDLMDDLRQMDYPTAFTLARARIPGVNLAFQRLSFEYRGRMTRSCRIGGGLEDMNVWSRSL